MANSTFTKTLSLMAYENNLTKDVLDDYILRVKTQSKTLNISAIAREVALRQGKYEQDETELILNKAFEVIGDAVSSGFIVKLPLCLIQPTASGVVMKSELSQAPDRKKIKVSASFSPGPQMRKLMDSATLELFQQPAPVGPLLNGVISTRSLTDDKGVVTRAPLTAGKMCVLMGNNIKLMGSDASVGILLTSVDTPSKTFFITPDDVNPNEPKKLQFVLPADMEDGAWTVKVTTQYGRGHNIVATPRSYILDAPLTLGDSGGGGEDVEDPTV